MVHHSLNHVSSKRRKEVAADLRSIYTASTTEEAELRLGEFDARWDAPAHWPILAQELKSELKQADSAF